jgi:2-oxoglutarate/2-oxoacid ferredoxin oxidoreductase subunit beta
MTTMADLSTTYRLDWCPGCGNFPLWMSFKQAAVKQGWDNTNSVIIAGIGCHGHLVNFTKMTSFEGLHGRPLPLATGVKLANPRLNTFVFTGDGDCLGEGGNHFIHACRRNHDLTVILHDNGLYALTTGQTSPLTPHDMKTKSTPEGNPDYQVNPLALAISAGATFVARGYASDIPQLTEMIIKANTHQGFALIDVLQPCVTFNHTFTHTFYQENCYYLPSEYDPSNKVQAFAKAQEFGLKNIPLGIFYQENKPSYESQLNYLDSKALYETVDIQRDLTALLKSYS